MFRRITYLFVLFLSLTARGQLPVIHLQYTDSLRQDTDICSTFRLINGKDTFDCLADMHIHGQTATRYKKKSLKLKLKDSDDNKLDVGLLGMREDNSWLLDAMASDLGRCRNRVSWDIWNAFSHPSYIKDYNPNSRNGIDGKFVEVYLNGEYNGLYCLNECLDRKQLKLKKYNEQGQRGLLVKSYYNSDMTGDKERRFFSDNTAGRWFAWNAKYPKAEEDEPLDWTPFVSIIHFLSTLDNETIAEHLHERIDLPVLQDLLLLNELMHGDDNIQKNLYFYFYDVTQSQVMGIAPWDMDATWGRDYKAAKVSPTTDLKAENTNKLFTTALLTKEINLSQRYAELRQSHWQTDSIKTHFTRYFQLFRQTGAAEREQQRWNGVNGLRLNFDTEEAYILQWIEQRMAYLDQKYTF